MGADAQYGNLVSRLLLADQWENQHVVTLPAPPARVAVMKLLSRTLLRSRIDGVEIKAPIFIIGTPRCGSTMLQDLLSAHPAIGYFTHAMGSFVDPTLYRAVDWMSRHSGLSVRGERYLKDSVFVDTYSPSEAMRFWLEQLQLDPYALTWPRRRIADFQPEQIDSIRRTIRYVLACFNGGRGMRFLNKSPALLTEVLLLQDIFPDARFIHLVRDGRMVANSLLKLNQRQREQDLKVDHPLFRAKPFIPYPRVPGLEQAIAQYGVDDLRVTAIVWDSSVKLVDEFRPHLPHFHQLRYEDFVAAPRTELAALLEFCGLDMPDASHRVFHDKLGQVGVVAHQNQYSGFDVVETIAGGSLRRYGYID